MASRPWVAIFSFRAASRGLPEDVLCQLEVRHVVPQSDDGGAAVCARGSRVTGVEPHDLSDERPAAFLVRLRRSAAKMETIQWEDMISTNWAGIRTPAWLEENKGLLKQAKKWKGELILGKPKGTLFPTADWPWEVCPVKALCSLPAVLEVATIFWWPFLHAISSAKWGTRTCSKSRPMLGPTPQSHASSFLILPMPSQDEIWLQPKLRWPQT